MSDLNYPDIDIETYQLCFIISELSWYPDIETYKEQNKI